MQPLAAVLATTPVYILIGFLLPLLLGLVYDRLGVGPASFGRALAITVAGSYAAGALWTVAFYFYRHFGAGIVHSVIAPAIELPVSATQGDGRPRFVDAYELTIGRVFIVTFGTATCTSRRRKAPGSGCS